MKHLLPALFLLFSTCAIAQSSAEKPEPIKNNPNDWVKFFSNGKKYYTLKNYEINYYSKETGKVFLTRVIQNLPESDIVGAAQSELVWMNVKCKDRIYRILGSSYFSEKDANGFVLEVLGIEQFDRKINKGSPMDKLLSMNC